MPHHELSASWFWARKILALKCIWYQGSGFCCSDRQKSHITSASTTATKATLLSYQPDYSYTHIFWIVQVVNCFNNLLQTKIFLTDFENLYLQPAMLVYVFSPLIQFFPSSFCIFWSDVLDSALFHHHQNRTRGHTFWESICIWLWGTPIPTCSKQSTVKGWFISSSVG